MSIINGKVTIYKTNGVQYGISIYDLQKICGNSSYLDMLLLLMQDSGSAANGACPPDGFVLSGTTYYTAFALRNYGMPTQKSIPIPPGATYLYNPAQTDPTASDYYPLPDLNSGLVIGTYTAENSSQSGGLKNANFSPANNRPGGKTGIKGWKYKVVGDGYCGNQAVWDGYIITVKDDGTIPSTTRIANTYFDILDTTIASGLMAGELIFGRKPKWHIWDANINVGKCYLTGISMDGSADKCIFRYNLFRNPWRMTRAGASFITNSDIPNFWPSGVTPPSGDKANDGLPDLISFQNYNYGSNADPEPSFALSEGVCEWHNAIPAVCNKDTYCNNFYGEGKNTAAITLSHRDDDVMFAYTPASYGNATIRLGNIVDWWMPRAKMQEYSSSEAQENFFTKIYGASARVTIDMPYKDEPRFMTIAEAWSVESEALSSDTASATVTKYRDGFPMEIIPSGFYSTLWNMIVAPKEGDTPETYPTGTYSLPALVWLNALIRNTWPDKDNGAAPADYTNQSTVINVLASLEKIFLPSRISLAAKIDPCINTASFSPAMTPFRFMALHDSEIICYRSTSKYYRCPIVTIGNTSYALFQFTSSNGGSAGNQLRVIRADDGSQIKLAFCLYGFTEASSAYQFSDVAGRGNVYVDYDVVICGQQSDIDRGDVSDLYLGRVVHRAKKRMEVAASVPENYYYGPDGETVLGEGARVYVSTLTKAEIGWSQSTRVINSSSTVRFRVSSVNDASRILDLKNRTYDYTSDTFRAGQGSALAIQDYEWEMETTKQIYVTSISYNQQTGTYDWDVWPVNGCPIALYDENDTPVADFSGISGKAYTRADIYSNGGTETYNDSGYSLTVTFNEGTGEYIAPNGVFMPNGRTRLTITVPNNAPKHLYLYVGPES